MNTRNKHIVLQTYIVIHSDVCSLQWYCCYQSLHSGNSLNYLQIFLLCMNDNNSACWLYFFVSWNQTNSSCAPLLASLHTQTLKQKTAWVTLQDRREYWATQTSAALLPVRVSTATHTHTVSLKHCMHWMYGHTYRLHHLWFQPYWKEHPSLSCLPQLFYSFFPLLSSPHLSLFSSPSLRHTCSPLAAVWTPGVKSLPTPPLFSGSGPLSPLRPTTQHASACVC